MSEYTIIADLHNHTIASDHAYSTLQDNVDEARNKRLLAIAVTDHAPKIPDAPHPWHFSCLNNNIPRYIDGIRVLKGVEVNVTNAKGDLDLESDCLEQLDVVIASIHGDSTSIETKAECDSAWINIAKNPNVDIIGHSGTPKFAYDYEKLIPIFKENGKAVEINENTFIVRKTSIDNCKRIALLCKKHKTPIVVNSDSHYQKNLGVFRRSLKMLSKIDFPQNLIINGSAESMNNFFNRDILF